MDQGMPKKESIKLRSLVYTKCYNKVKGIKERKKKRKKEMGTMIE